MKEKKIETTASASQKQAQNTPSCMGTKTFKGQQSFDKSLTKHE